MSFEHTKINEKEAGDGPFLKVKKAIGGFSAKRFSSDSFLHADEADNDKGVDDGVQVVLVLASMDEKYF